MAGLKGMDVTALVEEMVASMLGVPVAETDDRPDGDTRQVIGCVHLTGDEGGWQGSILVAMPEDSATAATATMFMLDAGDVDEELIADAMGEFANVLAGQAKTAIGGGCSLSLPSVTSGASLRMSVPGASLVDEKHYTSDLGHLVVSTLERT